MDIWRQYRDIDPGEQFVVGCDPGTGERNYSCAQFLSRTRLDVPIVYHTKEMAVQMTNDIQPVLEKIFDVTKYKAMVAYERGNGGMFEMGRLAGLNREGKYDIFEMPMLGKREESDTKKLGWETSSATRPKMLADLKDAIDGQLFNVYDKPTIEEMFSFIITQRGQLYKAKAEKGALDDTVMALAIAWQLHILLPMQTQNPATGTQFQRRRKTART